MSWSISLSSKTKEALKEEVVASIHKQTDEQISHNADREQVIENIDRFIDAMPVPNADETINVVAHGSVTAEWEDTMMKRPWDINMTVRVYLSKV